MGDGRMWKTAKATGDKNDNKERFEAESENFLWVGSTADAGRLSLNNFKNIQKLFNRA